MKLRIILTTLLFLLVYSAAMAQVPQAFHYQAVARDASGSVLMNQDISVQISVLKGSETGDVAYVETHSVTTSEVGIFTLEIGTGTQVGESSFASVNWASDNYYLALAIDVTGGTTYEALGASRLLSVPYALMAQKAVEAAVDFPTQIVLDTSAGDTSLIVNAVGITGLTAIRGNASTSGSNRGLAGTANSEASNPNANYGVFGSAPGLGTGSQIGVLGSAVNHDATGSNFRYGTYGQAASQGRENIGGFGIGLGTGNGDIVMPGEEVNGYVGSVNAGMIGWAQGNLNYNIGVRGRAYGSAGSRANVGVQGTADATANAHNIAFDVLVLNSQLRNTGMRGYVGRSPNSTGIELTVGEDSGNNKGMVLYVNRDGSSSIGAEIHADTALVLHGYTFSHNGATYNGNVQVNGDLSYSGSLNNTSDRNLKENIIPIDNALDIIMQLEPSSYNFKGNGSFNGLPLSTGLHYGLMAQDVEKVLPALVKSNTHVYSEEKEKGDQGPVSELESVIKEMEYKSLNYTELIPFLIKAMQEQQELIKALESKIADMEKSGK